MKVTIAFFFSAMLLLSSQANAGYNDTVRYVFLCEDDVLIKMQTAGWLVATKAMLGEKRVDRIMSMALTLLATGRPSGYFGEGQPINIAACGITAKPITVFGVKVDLSD